MFKNPGLFQKYFAGSPSISYGNGLLFEMEKECAKTWTDLNAQLVLTAGSLEEESMTGNMKKMAELQQSRNYPG